MITRLATLLLLASLFVSCSDDLAEPVTPSDSTESLNDFDVHIMDMRADLSVLKEINPEELSEDFQHYPGLPGNVVIGLVYVEVNPKRIDTLVELAIGVKVDFPVDDCGVQVFMRHYILNPLALTGAISNEQQVAYVKYGNVVAFRRFGQIDAVMTEITWRIVLLCSGTSMGVKPF